MKSTVCKKTIIFLTPIVVYTLSIAIIYSLVAEMIYTAMNDGVWIGIEPYYFRALLLFPFMLILHIATERAKYFWQFFAVVVALIFIQHIFINCYVFTTICILLTLINTSARASGHESLLRQTSWCFSLYFVVFFFIFGFTMQDFLQYVTVLSFTIVCILLFVTSVFKQMEHYIDINKKMSNMPAERILKTHTGIFLSVFVALVVVTFSLIIYGYRFVPMSIEFPEPNTSQEEILLPEQEKPEGQQGGNNDFLAELREDSEPWVGYTILANILEIVMWLTIAYYIIKGAVTLVRNFNKPIVEHFDVIESTVDTSTQSTRISKQKKERISIFDFSPSAQIRKRYIQKIRKKNTQPQVWQTPTEIERSVGVDIPDLHNLYQKARYSKEGCSRADL